MTESEDLSTQQKGSIEASYIDSLAATLSAQTGDNRLVVAIAGPPGGGKSTASELLKAALAVRYRLATQILPMDGFHYDNAVLEKRGLLARKGAPQTFDVDGLETVLRRLTTPNPSDVAVPVFDRKYELARAGARIIRQDTVIVLVEGNYLLLQDEPWCRLEKYFNFTVMIECDVETLRQRLLQRWLGFGLNKRDALDRVESNDLPNARTVTLASRRADCIVTESL